MRAQRMREIQKEAFDAKYYANNNKNENNNYENNNFDNSQRRMRMRMRFKSKSNKFNKLIHKK